MSSSNVKKGALFVCLGNICRSPIAEAVFAHVVKEKGVEHEWFWDSAGTGSWHIGSLPDKRARSVLSKHGVEANHRARQVCEEDFTTYDYIFGMDQANIDNLNELKPKGSKAKIELLGKYDPKKQTIIEDPYYESGQQAFETNYQQCLRSCTAFLDQFSK